MYSISRCNFQSGKRPKEMVVKEETRKGPWSEQEDLILVCHVRLFGERRWDFIARVSGLNRTGKSCRLRWLNYLHPGLKHGRLTPQEQHLILELHSKLGNRWSRIARKLPGRTDNEIKNYWRTHMRKKAHERENSSASLPTGCPSSCPAEPPVGEDCSSAGVSEKLGGVEVYPMELIWNEIATSELASGLSFEAGLNSSYCVWT